MAANEPSFDLGSLYAAANRGSTIASDIDTVFRALPGLLDVERLHAEWCKAAALVWSTIHGDRRDAPAPPIGPRGLISAAAEFSAMRSAWKQGQEALAAAQARITALEAPTPPEPAP